VTYVDFIAELHRADLSIRGFAALVHMQPNSISNYASVGEVPPHLGQIASLLSEMKANGVPFEAALARAAPPARRTRGRARPGRFGGDPQKQLDLDA